MKKVQEKDDQLKKIERAKAARERAEMKSMFHTAKRRDPDEE